MTATPDEDNGMRPTLWDRWLETVVAAVIGYGALLVVAGGLAGEAFERLGFGMTAAGITAGPAREYVFLLYGVLGAVLVGWLLLLLAVVRKPLRRREPWAWGAIAWSTAVWFVLDTGFSLAVGSPSHAAFNLVFAVALGLPLVALRPKTNARATSGVSVA